MLQLTFGTFLALTPETEKNGISGGWYRLAASFILMLAGEQFQRQ